jgi:hypothetical protein
MVLWIKRGEPGMTKRGHSEKEVLRVLGEAESGDLELCRRYRQISQGPGVEA